ncbi:MAG: hypothetical protein E7324_06995 [Clostridiales bacterium]|nr:hypothetical protein [Clostridiales bacterium]
MLKRLLCILLMLCLTPLALGEEAQTQPQFIYAQEGQPSALQISSLEGDQSVKILGIESEPVQRTWADFSQTFTTFLKKNWDVDVAFSDAIWSDGRWIRIFDAGYVIIHAVTTDDTDEGLVKEILLYGTEMDAGPDVQVLSGACLWAAARYSKQTQAFLLQLLMYEDHTEDWCTEEPTNIWVENGFQLSFGRTEMGYPLGRVAYTEELEIQGGYATMGDDVPNIQPVYPLEQMWQKLCQDAEIGPLSGYLSVPVLPDAYDVLDGGRVYQVEWDDCYIVLYTDADGAYLQSAMLACMSGDTVSACAHFYPLYNAIAAPEEDLMPLTSTVMGGHGTWTEMSALFPLCVVNGVAVQCIEEEIQEGYVLPVVYIYGATPN